MQRGVFVASWQRLLVPFIRVTHATAAVSRALDTFCHRLFRRDVSTCFSAGHRGPGCAMVAALTIDAAGPQVAFQSQKNPVACVEDGCSMYLSIWRLSETSFSVFYTLQETHLKKTEPVLCLLILDWK